MKTYQPSQKDFDSKTYLINASGKTLGRLATRVASLLIGKGKVAYTRDRVAGDQVIVVNVSQIEVTGKKRKQKMYKHYTGYPGGLRTYAFEDFIQQQPEELFRRAVSRMLPKNRLGDRMLKHLRVYGGAEHTQRAQKPIPLEV